MTRDEHLSVARYPYVVHIGIVFKRMCNPLLSDSFLLLGARGTGKSRLVSTLLNPEKTLVLDLLIPELERTLRRRPSHLVKLIQDAPRASWVFIDEVQKIPELLDLVHQHIEKRSNVRFALTGSSARKLKRGSANLLAGRAISYQLFPLTFSELGDSFSLEKILRWGSLPKVINSETDEEKKLFLETYAHTYVKEEVISEQLVRNLRPFESFLEVAAQMSGEIVNYSKIAREIDSEHKSVTNYFEILQDTLMGFMLPGFATSARKRLVLSPKFYFFDSGVKRALDFSLDETLRSGSYGFGKAFETLVIQECYRLNSYLRKNFELSYVRTQTGQEIDLVFRKGRRALILVEIKSTYSVREEHLGTLLSLGADMKPTARYCLSLDSRVGEENGVRIRPWLQGICEIMGI